MIELGYEVQHVVTGFKGIALGKTQWLTGCARIPELKVIKKKSVIVPVSTNKGGPRPKQFKRSI